MSAEEISKLIDAADRISGFTARDGVFAIALLTLFAAPTLVFLFLRNGLLRAHGEQLKVKIFAEFAHYLRMTRWLAAAATVAAAAFWIYREASDFTEQVRIVVEAQNELARQGAEKDAELRRLRAEVQRLAAERSIVVFGRIEGVRREDFFRVAFMDPQIILHPLDYDGRPVWLFAVIFTSEPRPDQQVILRYECQPSAGATTEPRDCEVEQGEVVVLIPQRLRGREPVTYEFHRQERTLRYRG